MSGIMKGWQTTVISWNNTSIITETPLPNIVSAGDTIVISDASWMYAGRTNNNQLVFEVPNCNGLPIQMIGRSSNSNGIEGPIDQSFIGRYTVQGNVGSLLDSRLPPQPNFALEAPGDGTLLLHGISIQTLIGTTTVSEAVLVTYAVDETTMPITVVLSVSLGANDLILPIGGLEGTPPKSYLQIDNEIIQIVDISEDGLSYDLNRALAGSSAGVHLRASIATILETQLTVVPLGQGFFTSKNQDTFHYTIVIPDRKMVASQLCLVNSKGFGLSESICYLTDGTNGIHTYDGKTVILQISTNLSVKADAAASLTIERGRSVRDIQALWTSLPLVEALSLQ